MPGLQPYSHRVRLIPGLQGSIGVMRTSGIVLVALLVPLGSLLPLLGSNAVSWHL